MTFRNQLDGAGLLDLIPPGGITTVHLGASSVTAPILADGSVEVLKLADAAVITAKLADGAVSEIKLGDASVSSVKLATDLQSDNYDGGGAGSPGTQGWYIGRDDGHVEFGDGLFRGTVIAGGGNVELSDVGLTLTEGEDITNRITWYDPVTGDPEIATVGWLGIDSTTRDLEARSILGRVILHGDQVLIGHPDVPSGVPLEVSGSVAVGGVLSTVGGITAGSGLSVSGGSALDGREPDEQVTLSSSSNAISCPLPSWGRGWRVTASLKLDGGSGLEDALLALIDVAHAGCRVERVGGTSGTVSVTGGTSASGHIVVPNILHSAATSTRWTTVDVLVLHDRASSGRRVTTKATMISQSTDAVPQIARIWAMTTGNNKPNRIDFTAINTAADLRSGSTVKVYALR